MNPNHHEQIKHYMRFFKNKRERQVQEIQQIFNDARESNLGDGDMFNTEEVENILQGVSDAVQSNYRNDLQLTVNMSVLAIKQLFDDADAQEVELEMDTSKIEDAALIQEVDRIHLDAPSAARRKTGKLVSLKDQQHRLAEENIRSRQQVDHLKHENDSLQDKLIASNAKLSNMAMEIERMKREFERQSTLAKKSNSPEQKSPEPESKSDGEKSSSSSMINLQQMLDDGRESESMLRAQLDDAKALLELNGIDLESFTSKIVNSGQFRQLKKMLNSKNEQLLDLRKRMLAYEPDSTQAAGNEETVSLQRHK